MRMGGMTIRAIAEKEGVGVARIQKSLAQVAKKIEKLL